MKKRMLSIGLTAALALGTLAGCGSTSGSGTPASSGTPENSATSAAQTNTDSTEEVTLTLSHDLNEENSISFMEQAIEKFEEANPGIKIDMETLSSDDYNSMLRNKIAADDVPDLFFIDDINKKHEFIDAGIVADISDQSWLAENVQENAIAACTEDGKTWCLPMFVSGMFVTYNKDVFEAAGIKETPETWSAFLDDCQKIKDSGKTPIAAGFQEQWVLFSDEQCDSVVTTVKNDKNNRLELAEGKTTWTEDKGHFSEVLKRMKERFQYVNDDPFGTDWNTAQNMLATGEAGMILNGSWTPAGITSINPDANIGIFPLPLTEDPADCKLALHSSPGGFAVYDQSQYKEQALKFLEFLSTPEIGELEQNVKGDISACKNLDIKEDAGVLYDISQYINQDKVFDWTGYSELFASDELEQITTDVETEFLMDKDMTVEQALQMMDEKFASALAAKK